MRRRIQAATTKANTWAAITKNPIRTAVTGRKTLGTLHTSDAVSGLRRMRDMGLEGGRLAESCHAVISLRLVRRLCPHCREPKPILGDDKKLMEPLLRMIPHAEDLPQNREAMWIAKGCEKCHGLGYKGRIAVVEVILMDKAIEETVRHTSSERELWHAARPQQIRRMAQDGAVKVLTGVTSLDELSRMVDLRDEVMLETIT